MKSTNLSIAEIRQHRLGLRIAARLSAGAADLPPDVQERLRAAREQALARRKRPVVVTVTAPQSADQAVALGQAGGAAVLGGMGGFGALGSSLSGGWGGLARLLGLGAGGRLEGDGSGWWPRIVSISLALALAVGLVAIDVVQDDQHTTEVADVDSALLTDDLPPQAYADPGFAQFLKNSDNDNAAQAPQSARSAPAPAPTLAPAAVSD